MKTIKKYIYLTLAVLFAVSCDSDIEKIVVTGFQAAVLTATAEDVVLSDANSDQLVFSLVWDSGELKTSDPEKYGLASTALTNTLQISVQSDFAKISPFSETSNSVSYTGESLNALALKLGFVPGESSKLYARIKSELGSEIKYSNVVSVSVTPYEASQSGNYLYMATDDLSSFPWKLYSRAEDGKYDGFMQVSQWFNFYLTSEESAEAETIYGSYPEDGGQYKLHSGDDRWKCWISTEGYVYLNADINALTWSETAVNSLTVVGDFNSWSDSATPMTYDEANKVWKVEITTASAEQWGIKILINNSWTFFFGIGDDDGICNLYTADANGFPYTAVGTHTLILDLSDPQTFKYRVE